MRVKKIMRIRQNGPFEKFMRFLFMCSSVSCTVMYSVIKIYVTNLCDQCLTHIIHINKTRVEKYCIMVLKTDRNLHSSSTQCCVPHTPLWTPHYSCFNSLIRRYEKSKPHFYVFHYCHCLVCMQLRRGDSKSNDALSIKAKVN